MPGVKKKEVCVIFDWLIFSSSVQLKYEKRKEIGRFFAVENEEHMLIFLSQLQCTNKFWSKMFLHCFAMPDTRYKGHSVLPMLKYFEKVGLFESHLTQWPINLTGWSAS